MIEHQSRFVSHSLAGITFGVGETEANRADAFFRPFNISRDQDRVFIDAGGYPLALSAAWTAGLSRYAAVELERAGRVIATPSEIRTLWKPDVEGRNTLTRRYFGHVDAMDVVADVSRNGWRFATARDPLFDLPALSAAGERPWSREIPPSPARSRTIPA